VTDPTVLRVSRTCAIPLAEVEWRTSTSGGPGGQHANTSRTRVEVSFDIERSPSLGPRQRARLLEKVGPVARAVAGDERSQTRNRALALERLRSTLADGLHIDPARVATKPSRAAKKRRLDAKRRHSQRKRDRSSSNWPD
jgi:ribosome-associated protein